MEETIVILEYQIFMSKLSSVLIFCNYFNVYLHFVFDVFLIITGLCISHTYALMCICVVFLSDAMLIFLDVPSSPIGPLQVTDVTSQSATLHWNRPENDGGLPLKQFIVERRDAKRLMWVKAGTVQAPTTSTIVNDLLNDSRYVFRVSAENAEGVSLPLEAETSILCRKAPG